MNSLNTNEHIAQSYNDLPYTSYVFAHCQPNRLQALAKIKGLNPPDIENAKILEIGCSFGGNLLPFAIRHPNSQLYGIDISENQINIGKQMINEIGINNVTLIAADISKIVFTGEKFDYIICHGVFSWVPDFVKEAILNCIQQYLAPNGIAFISYNTYPGWHLKEMAKKLMQFGSDPQTDKLSRTDQAFELLNYTNNILNKTNSHLSKELDSIFNKIINSAKYYIAHEYFEENNHPMYFCDFITKIGEYGLGYVTDSSVPNFKTKFILNNEYGKVCELFNNDILKIEQYIDMLTNREFRCSIITHKDNLIQNNISNTEEQYTLCHSFYNLNIKTNLDYHNNSDKEPKQPNQWQVREDNLFFQASSFTNELVHNLKKLSTSHIGEIYKLLENREDYNQNSIQDILMYIVHSQNTYLSFKPLIFSFYGEKPFINEKLRKMIKFVMNNANITTLSNSYYQPINLDFLTCYLAQFLDGSNTIEDLIAIIRDDIENSRINWNKDNIPQKNSQLEDQEIKENIITCLEQLYINGYFNQIA